MLHFFIPYSLIIQVFIFEKISLLMLAAMKKALKDLATAHVTKNMLRVRNIKFFIFFYKIWVFALKHVREIAEFGKLAKFNKHGF